MVVSYFGYELNISSKAFCSNSLIGSFPSEESAQTFCQYRLSWRMEPLNLEDQIDIGITKNKDLFFHNFSPNRLLRFKSLEDRPYGLED
jgi:hypothetical protein